jgi:polyisoprenoid-binding protein YceI
MTSRFVAFVVVVLLGAAPALAQSRGAKSDPVTGAWAGELKVDDDTRSIVMDLEFDGTSKVTGTFTGMPRPGDVKAGTFDPKTGALKLELGIQGDSAVRLTLEGTLAKDKAAGRVTGEASGTFTLAKKAKQ